jgi:glutamate synthase domain-containing protein 1
MSNANKPSLRFGYPEKTGLYDPTFEKDSCGVGFVANIKGQPSHQIMLDAYHLNSRMDHRGGCGFEANTGDGAGILMALPNHRSSQKESFAAKRLTTLSPKKAKSLSVGARYHLMQLAPMWVPQP